ncbi:MAG: ABC transporter substrate-binding protein [Actinobacteria bacterium]|nr:ABC transporter substrate-binding protein [Actinomycetota bacterium]
MYEASRRRPRPRLLPAGVIGVMAVVASACGGGGGNQSGTVTIKWYSYKEPGGSYDDAAARCSKASNGKYRIQLQVLPNDADQQREQLVRRLAARDSDIDLMSMDVIWTPEFAQAGWIAPWDPSAARAVTEGRLKPAVKTATWKGRLYAAPFTSNTQLFWYRKSLTPTPPATWEEALGAARRLAATGKPHLFQEQGQRYEGLVVWFTSLVASAGTSVLNEDGTKVVLERTATEKALRVMKEVSTSVAAPPALATAREDDGRLAWEAGSSAFMINYTFVWPSANGNAPAIAKDMGWARYPGIEGAGPSRVTIGGFNIGVGAYGKNKDLAFEAARCLTSEQNQLDAAIKGGLLPTTETLYDDPKLTQATQDVPNAATGKTQKVRSFPYADVLKATLKDAVLRPQTPFYNDVSLAIARTIHPTAGIDPVKDVDRLRSAITKALKGEGLE